MLDFYREHLDPEEQAEQLLGVLQDGMRVADDDARKLELPQEVARLWQQP